MLTDDRIADLTPYALGPWHLAFARAVEAEATAELRAEINKLRTEITFLCNVWDRLDPKGYASYCENHE